VDWDEIPKPLRVLLGAVALVFALLLTVMLWDPGMLGGWRNRVGAAQVAAALAEPLDRGELPVTLDLPDAPGAPAYPEYTIDASAQAHMLGILRQYKPDHAAFVALDASSGEVLALVSYTRAPSLLGNLAVKAMFPAASVFKIITAAAAVDREGLDAETLIPYTGSDHTLYRHQVLDSQKGRRQRYATLREAFAKSINTVFGKIGMFFLKPLDLEEYARRFLFNRPIPTDLPVEQGRITFSSDNQWSMAELASGYNWLAQMSPVQGAMIAAAIANDGELMAPHLVRILMSDSGEILYQARPRVVEVTMAPESAAILRSMMTETVRAGTSHTAFKGFRRQPAYSELEVGGKTGSLSSLRPKGKCDWFVGYAIQGQRRIALAALTINEVYWRVKSSFLARSFFEHYFRPKERIWVPEE